MADAQHPLFAIPVEIRRVLLSAQPDFLDAAFGVIRSEFGEIETYLDAIGVGEQIRARVRDLLLVDGSDG